MEKTCVCLECGGQLEFWEEYVYEERRKIRSDGTPYKRTTLSKSRPYGTYGLKCLKCGKEYNAGEKLSDAEHELFDICKI